MTPAQRVISLLVGAHLLALLVGAIPEEIARLHPVRPALESYLRASAQTQIWNMFYQPKHASDLVRLGYRLRRADGTSTVQYERVFPVGDPERWKLVAAYFDSFADKAFTAATVQYHKLRSRVLDQPLPTPAMMRELLPFTRYYGRRRVAAGLPAGTSLEAVEFWRGVVAQPISASNPYVEDRTSSSIDWELWGVDDLQ